MYGSLHSNVVLAKLIEDGLVFSAKAVEDVPVELLEDGVLEIKSFDALHQEVALVPDPVRRNLHSLMKPEPRWADFPSSRGRCR